VLEDHEIARARGARIYAEVVGYGCAGDAWDLIQPVEKGEGTARAMRWALQRRDVPVDEVDLINPHGTSTPLGDLREAQAIQAVFGDRASEIAISGTKSMTGHLMGAAGAVEGVFTVLSVFHQMAPATLNYREPDPEIPLNVVHGESKPMEIRYAMSDNIGLGGHNGAVIFQRYDGD
jgi:3-oxoacyl-(acyl-carrier-protein) synthase